MNWCRLFHREDSDARDWRRAYELLVEQTGRDLNDGYGVDPRKHRMQGPHSALLSRLGGFTMEAERIASERMLPAEFDARRWKILKGDLEEAMAVIENAREVPWSYDLDAAPAGDRVLVSFAFEDGETFVSDRECGNFENGPPPNAQAYAWQDLPPAAPLPATHQEDPS